MLHTHKAPEAPVHIIVADNADDSGVELIRHPPR
jgi:hypothetical protein